jgi:ABC-type uncharacterized transport system involved in gliding motility auxiliary subunit
MKLFKAMKPITTEISASRLRLFKFLAFLAAGILVNLALTGVLLRIDLTGNRQFSLSKTSRQTVNRLEEPLTIKVFLSENLPPPYQNLHQDLRDILEVYGLNGNKFFNYSIYSIRGDEFMTTADQEIRDMAAAYGIGPVEIQDIKESEMTLLTAWMGIVFIQGDMTEVIPVIDPNQNLELLLTRNIQKLTERSTVLLGMEENINVEMIFSSSLYKGGPVPADYLYQLEEVFVAVNQKNFDRFTLVKSDPDTESGVATRAAAAGLTAIDFRGTRVYAGLIVTQGSRQSIIDLALKGEKGYELLNPAQLEPVIEEAGYKVAGLRRTIGYLADHMTPPLFQMQYPGMPESLGINNFRNMISQQYNLTEVYLTDGPIPEGISTLIIAGPHEPFTEWELYQIDQFLMKGNSVMVFYEPWQEMAMEQFGMGGGTFYQPMSTGLEGLLTHYGVGVESAFVMDQNCFKQYGQNPEGGFIEMPYYFAPKITGKQISKELPMLKLLKQMVLVQNSALVIPEGSDPERVKVLVRSSDKAWLQKDVAVMNPEMIEQPADGKYGQYPLAAIVDGSFTSYFTGKAIPATPDFSVKESDPYDMWGMPQAPPPEEEKGSGLVVEGDTTGQNPFIGATEAGKLFVMGTYRILYDDIFINTPDSQQTLFVLGMIDHMNGRDNYAEMRNKGQNYSPLFEVHAVVKLLIQAFALVMVPLFAVLAGIIMLIRRSVYRKKLRNVFTVEAGKNA